METTKLNTIAITLFVIVSVALVFLTAFTKYIFAKDYFFYVESPCDENTEICFVRDCDEYCPPNELAIYKSFYVKAYDFTNCEDNSCQNICSAIGIANGECIAIECVSETGDSCTSSTN